MEPWWTEMQGGLIGGIGGSVLGCLGGLLGTLAGIFAPQGKCKTLVIGLSSTLIVFGIAALIAGAFALVSKQPYHVYYPLLLMGTITTVAFGGLLPMIFRRYREADARRYEAEELRRS